jgi:light-regulated signal transduction histidine kinase (bacteriophytochrome)
MNPAFEKLSGFKGACGKPSRELPHQPKQSIQEKLASVVYTGEPIRFIEFREEDSKWFELYAFRPDTGEQTKVGVLLTDITERMLADQAKERMAEQLERTVLQRTDQLIRSNEDLQQFAHVASHDLKEPVRKILIFCDLLDTRFANEVSGNARDYVGKINGAATRMKEMIEGVLTYSSVNAEEKPITAVNLNEILTAVLVDLEIIIREKNAVVHSDKLPVVEGARILLHQLFYNLINNALKFCRNDVRPQLQVTSGPVEGRPNLLRLSFRDNGIGFSKESASRIFNPFVRLHSKYEIEGNGLGLALCKRIVERHKGKIYAIGHEGEGAEFVVELPLRQF